MVAKMSKYIEQLEREIESKALRRARSDEKFITQLDRAMKRADKLIGEINRDGQTVYYCWPQGGRYREGSHFDLSMFLIRNKYV